jgi:hypothetical protein
MTPIEETHKNLIRWLNKPISELDRKAKKAYRHKQKICTQEDEDFSLALRQLTDSELDEIFLINLGETNV